VLYAKWEREIVISVDVTWGSMEFIYTDDFDGNWNPENHTYKDSKAAYWSYAEGANKIAVTNHSNTAITASLTYTPKAGYSGITGSFSQNNIVVQTAVGTLPSNAPTGSSNLTLSGALDKNVAASTVIGTVTVTIN